MALAKEQGIELFPGDFVDATLPALQSAQQAVKRIPVAKWPGTLRLGTLDLPVYVLDDGRRVITRGGATAVLTSGKGGGNLESYIGVGALKGYIPDDFSEQMFEIELPEVVNKTVLGMTAESFLEICTAYARALGEGKRCANGN